MVDLGFLNIGLSVCNFCMFFGLFSMYLRMEKAVISLEKAPVVKQSGFIKKEKKPFNPPRLTKKNRVIAHSDSDLYKKEMEKAEDPS